MSLSPQTLSGRILSSESGDTDAQSSNAQRVRQLQDSMERAECFEHADRLDLVAGVLEWLSGSARDPQILLTLCSEVVEVVEEGLQRESPLPARGNESLDLSSGPSSDNSSSPGLLSLMSNESMNSNLQVQNSKLLGQILIELGVLKAESIETALRMQRGSGRRLGEVLVEQGTCTWEQIERAVEVQRKLKRAVGGRI